MVSGRQGRGNHAGIGEPRAQWLKETSAASPGLSRHMGGSIPPCFVLSHF